MNRSPGERHSKRPAKDKHRHMTRIMEVVTPENVAIRYELAGFGSRALAALLDMCYQIAAYLGALALMLLIFWLLSGAEELVTKGKVVGLSNAVVSAILIIAFFLISWGYYIAFETLWDGETPGKRWMKLRVVKDGGYPLDFRAAVIRNLVRTVDMIPAYGLGFIAMLATPHYKRLGDLAAGTQVVRHGHDDAPKRLGFLGEAVVFRLLDATTISQLARLTREEYRTLKHFLERRTDLPPALRATFAERLATPLIEKFAYKPPDLGMDYERWLEELDLAYRTRALGVSNTASPMPEPPAPVPEPDGRKW
jgi:uncharacterized RDD family membrane protein YckC